MEDRKTGGGKSLNCQMTPLTTEMFDLFETFSELLSSCQIYTLAVVSSVPEEVVHRPRVSIHTHPDLRSH